MSTTTQPKYYRFSFRGVKLDPYRIIQVYGITNPAHQHALKKLLRAGNSVKPLIQDIDEVILSLNRWKEMINEEQVTTQQEGCVEDRIRKIIDGTEDPKLLATLNQREREIYEEMLAQLKRDSLNNPDATATLDRLVESNRRRRRVVRPPGDREIVYGPGIETKPRGRKRQ